MTYDLIVIGGGINGVGIARDAAMRGLKVCILEKNDWGWATSAKSSRLAHGGLRYLELFEFGLVHEALHEREHWLNDAPHLSQPLRFLYPIYPHVAARRTVRVGLLLYDVLSRGKSMPKRKFLNRQQTLALAPGLHEEGLTGGATYYDGQIRSPERFIQELVWETRQLGADARNHTTVTGLIIEDDLCQGVVIDGPQGHEELRAKAVVNAAGPWVDDVLGHQGKPLIRKTKGIHVVVPKFVDVALIVKAARDDRTFFILPTDDACIIGTTDTDFVGDAGQATATAEDVAYVIEEASRYFPDAPLSEIQYTYAGVRALVNQDGLTESNVTRRHIIHDHAKDGVAGLWSLQGGKITTYRSLAHEAVRQVCTYMGKKQQGKPDITKNKVLAGCPSVPWLAYRAGAIATAMEEGLPEVVASHLVQTYGARWRMVLECDARPEARQRIAKPAPHIFAEVTWAVQQEQASTLADVMLRRTTLGLQADGNPKAANAVAAWMTQLNLDPKQGAYDAECRVLAIPTIDGKTITSGPGHRGT